MWTAKRTKDPRYFGIATKIMRARLDFIMKAHPDRKADEKAPSDREEAISMMEPMVVSDTSRHRAELGDLALELASESSAFKSSLPQGVLAALADLVRSMNCYYSNLIEGHDTHPTDIERALKNDFSTDARKRDLQLEAKAHITVQKWIDEGGLTGRATTAENLQEIHRRFCALLPPEMLRVTDPDTGERHPLTPGAFRQRDVRVGAHIAISPGAVPRFIARFENAYAKPGKVDAILSAASAHHRLLWIHPFLDGNGRTMLIVHTELCSRANFSIDWSSSKKMDYLQALTQELKTPDRGLLDGYFKPLIRKLPARKVWMDHIKALPGLDGAHTEDDNMAYAADDVQAMQRYEEASQLRKRSQQG
jgi:prophage maintenance system killer protein